MTIRELDDLLWELLSEKPHTAREIHAYTENGCSIYDVQACLNIWTRNGWAVKHENGKYEAVRR